MPQGHFLPEGTRLNTPENRAVSTRAAMEKAAEEQRILEGVVTMCDASHNLIGDFNGMTGLIPRSEAAMGVESGETKEIAVLSRVGKPVCFQIIGEGAGQYLFSRARVQQRALHYFLQHFYFQKKRNMSHNNLLHPNLQLVYQDGNIDTEHCLHKM